MHGKVSQIKAYLEAVLEGKVQPKQEILSRIQEILNLLPNLNNTEMVRSFAAKNNDFTFLLYVCSLSKAVISLHSLINNKLANKQLEVERVQQQDDAKKNEKKSPAAISAK